MLCHVLSIKGEVTKLKNKNVELNLYFIAHNGFGFDSYVVLNSLIWGRNVVRFFKNGAGIVSLLIFN